MEYGDGGSKDSAWEPRRNRMRRDSRDVGEVGRWVVTGGMDDIW